MTDYDPNRYGQASCRRVPLSVLERAELLRCLYDARELVAGLIDHPDTSAAMAGQMRARLEHLAHLRQKLSSR